MLVFAMAFGLGTGIASLAQRNPVSNSTTELPRRATLTATLVSAVLVAIGALRWRVGTDYWTYESLFPIYADEVSDGLSILDEPGLRIIAWIAMSINGDSATMFAMAAIITIGLFTRVLWRWSPAFAFSVAIYILSGAWHGSFNGIRQYLACAVLFAGHRYIIDRNLLKWLMVVLVAGLFHISAIVGLLLYLVPTRHTSIRTQFGILTLGIVGMFGLGAFLNFLERQTGDSDIWAGSYAVQELNPLRVAFAFVPIALFWFLRRQKSIVDAKSWFYVNMLAVYAATYLASASSALMARFAIYALPFIAIGLATVTSVEDPKERSFLRILLVCVYAIFMYIEISNIENLNNFQWIFQRP